MYQGCKTFLHDFLKNIKADPLYFTDAPKEMFSELEIVTIVSLQNLNFHEVFIVFAKHMYHLVCFRIGRNFSRKMFFLRICLQYFQIVFQVTTLKLDLSIISFLIL